MKSTCVICALSVIALSSSFATAHAVCLTKGAEATAATAESAKWFALETMVQSVSWGLWPGFVATGTVSGYRIVNQHYRCTPGGVGVSCRGTATFCKH